jgi:hypothetical protein
MTKVMLAQRLIAHHLVVLEHRSSLAGMKGKPGWMRRERR